MEPESQQSFEEFWVKYLRKHSDPHTRQLHFLGTAIGLTLVLMGLILGRFSLIIFGILAAYGVTWYSHFMVEKNRPQSFENPLWSVRGDLRMFYLMATGKIDEELKRLAISR